MSKSIYCYIKKLILSLLVFAGCSVSLFSQTTVNGIINQYGHVTSIGDDFVVVDDLTQFNQFAAGDTVLLIQMKGVDVWVKEDSDFGSLQNSYGEPGKYEFLIISSVVPGTRTIIFRNDILNTAYDLEGILQIIKVPSFNSAIVDVSDLTCAPWDSTSKTGGVLTMIVGRTLSLNRNIDVSGMGFAGGAISVGDGDCIISDILNLDKRAYNSSFSNSGFKGESQAIKGFYLPGPVYPTIYPAYAKGKGAILTGGGGGNGRFSGGGGGSNYGEGGNGGYENDYCFETYLQPPGKGGLGGKKLSLTGLDGGIFLGGGGGGSTYFNDGSIPSPGGNGGGIIIIVCDTIIGNGNSIIANGATTTEASLNAGSGGGGGGGSIALYLSSFSTSDITISANGGKGGDNSENSGQGGGGGGGLINIKNMVLPSSVTREIVGGEAGIRTGFPLSTTAFDGKPGQSRTDFVVVLNGFLFNSINSSVTGDKTDSICSNMLPPMITGTAPAGGTLPYTYLWEKSYDAAFLAPITLVNDADPTNYTPTFIETNTVWYRRTITDSSFPIPLEDISKPVKIIVQPFIKNNIVGTSDTICFAQDPPAFSSTGVLADGNGSYSFKWEVSTDASLYNTPLNTYNTEGYTPPPALELTSWYRRTVSSGRCIDSSAIVKITVLDTISNNKILNLPPDICHGMLFTDITATTSPALAGGDNSYRFKWESSPDASTWVTATGTSNGADYNPDELSPSFPGSEYYRRVVYSGSDDVCVNFSTPVLLNDYPVITNNSITGNQTICSGSAPAILPGSDPLNGDGTYTYIWRDSTKNHTWADIAGATARDYQPPSLSDTTWYRRVVFSSACSDISNSIVVNVHKPILNNVISLIEGGLTDTTICNGAVPNMFVGTSASGGTDIPGDYAYQWFFSTDNISWNPVTAAGTGVNFQSPALSVTTWYRRQVISGTCTVISSATITVNVLPLITNNVISSGQTVCYNTVPALLTGATLSGGDGTYSFLWEQSTDGISWTPADGTNNLASGSYQPPALMIPMKYKRTVNSGASDCCTSVSNVIDIGIYDLPTGIITNTTDTTICEGSQVSLRVHLTGAAPWIVIYKENSTEKPAVNITGADATILADPATVNASATFDYSLYSVVDKNGCVATSLSGIKKADVYKVPTAYAGPDAVVCGPVVTLNATASVGTGTWSYPATAIISDVNDPFATVTIDSVFANGSISHQFTWKEINWQCESEDIVEISFNKRVYKINAGPDTTLFTFDNIIYMVADPLEEWESGEWSVVSGTGDFGGDASSHNAKVSNLTKGFNQFLWTVTNGECMNEDMVDVNVYELIIPEGFSPNNDPGNFNNIFEITGLDLNNQIAELKVINGAGTEVFSTSNIIRNEDWVNWDGKNLKGVDLPEGTYYYLLKIISKGNNQVFKKSGFIILKRY